MSAPISSTFAELDEAVHDDVVNWIDRDDRLTMQNPQMRGANASMTLEEFFEQR